MAQAMPVFSIMFFILSLGNCGFPLTINFVGEFMSLFGVFERLPLLGVFACSSFVFSAAYTIFMYNINIRKYTVRVVWERTQGTEGTS